jgi:N-acetylmuramoyl-L-alanine amidase
MSEDYEVEPGDCMSSIAYSKGFFWQTLWNDSSNADLKARRKNPNVLMTGDIVHVPDLTVKNEPGATEARHKFMLKGVPEKLRIKLLDANGKPRANLDYIIVIDGSSRRGQTSGSGELIESIPPSAREGKITLGKDQSNEIPLKLGHLEPVSEGTGVKARLANLGFYSGPIDANLGDDAAQTAIRAFQTQYGLPVTGTADDATRDQLQKLHGH